MNQEELTLTICTLCLELYFKVVLLMKVCVQAIWENVATKVKLLCVMCKLSCKVCSQESCSLELECKAGGKFHMKLNICLRLIVYKYHEGNVKRTLKRKLQVPEIAGMKANDMMPFSKIAVCRHQAGCISCAFLCLCGYTVYLALHAMMKLHVNTKHA